MFSLLSSLFSLLSCPFSHVKAIGHLVVACKSMVRVGGAGINWFPAACGRRAGGAGINWLPAAGGRRAGSDVIRWIDASTR